jgi:hypothetical protein
MPIPAARSLRNGDVFLHSLVGFWKRAGLAIGRRWLCQDM